MSRKSSGTALGLIGLASAPAMALQPASIPVGPMQLTPTVELTEFYDDNYRATDDAESSWITRLTPTLTLSAQDRNNIYQLQYSLNAEWFEADSDDDNVDHHLTGSAGIELNARNRIDISGGWHDTTSVDDVDSASGDPDEYTRWDAGAVYTFGAASAKGNVELGYRHFSHRSNNDENLDTERDDDTLSAVFYYRVAPKTRALFEVRHTEHDYVSNTRLDSTDLAYLVGATWDATAKTSGFAKVGYEEKSFDDSSLDDTDSSAWEVGVTWAPRTYSTFGLSTNRGVDEGDDGAASIDRTDVRLDWDHAWNSRVSSNVFLSMLDEDYDTGRNDEIQSVGVGVTYAIRRWMDIGVGYTYWDKDSTLDSENFNRNQFMLKLAVGL